MNQLAIALIAQAVMLPVLVQLVVYVLTPNSSYTGAWKRTGQLFASLFALHAGPDRRMVVAALVLTAYLVGLPLALGLWAS